MIKTILTISTLICLGSYCQAQIIPNSDFESWEDFSWFMNPTDWTTMNNQVQEFVFRDSAAYSGDWAMRVESLPDGIGESGHATVEIPISYIPSSLDFHVKYDRTVTAGLGVTITFYNEENYVYSGYWSPEDEISDWTSVSLALDQIEPIITHAIIDVWVIIGDFAPGDGWIAVDGMGFELVNGVSDFEILELNVFPNPASDLLYIDGLDVGTEVFIYNSLGELIQSEVYARGMDVSELAPEQYFIDIRQDDGLLRKGRFVVK